MRCRSRLDLPRGIVPLALLGMLALLYAAIASWPANAAAYPSLAGDVAGAGQLFPRYQSSAQTGDLVAALAKSDGTVLQFGRDAYVSPSETADVVVAVGGDVTVAGHVDTAVAVGGDIIVSGTVEETCVAVGGDVILRSSAVVGSTTRKNDAAIVLVGGQLRRAQGAEVHGDITTVRGRWFTDTVKWGAWNPLASPLHTGSIVSWFIQTAVLMVLAIVAVAVAPRQVQAVSDTLRTRGLASLGWGALTSFIILPVTVVLLVITIVGLLIAIPAAFIALPLAYLFAFLCLAVFAGRLVVKKSQPTREDLILAAVVGVVLVNLVRLIPFAGSILVLLGTVVAAGAVVLAIAGWQRRRREQRRAQRALADPSAAAPTSTPPTPSDSQVTPQEPTPPTPSDSQVTAQEPTPTAPAHSDETTQVAVPAAPPAPAPEDVGSLPASTHDEPEAGQDGEGTSSSGTEQKA